jgi:hypothetical protein
VWYMRRGGLRDSSRSNRGLNIKLSSTGVYPVSHSSTRGVLVHKNYSV